MSNLFEMGVGCECLRVIGLSRQASRAPWPSRPTTNTHNDNDYKSCLMPSLVLPMIILENDVGGGCEKWLLGVTWTVVAAAEPMVLPWCGQRRHKCPRNDHGLEYGSGALVETILVSGTGCGLFYD